MDPRSIAGKPDGFAFAKLIIAKDYDGLFQWHRVNTPWVADEMAWAYVQQYKQQIQQIDDAISKQGTTQATLATTTQSQQTIMITEPIPQSFLQ